MKIFVKTNDVDIRDLICKVAERKNVQVGDVATVEKFNCIGFYSRENTLVYTTSESLVGMGYDLVSLEELLQRISSVEEKVKIGEYEVLFNDDSIELGCQTITTASIAEILRRMNSESARADDFVLMVDEMALEIYSDYVIHGELTILKNTIEKIYKKLTEKK